MISNINLSVASEFEKSGLHMYLTCAPRVVLHWKYLWVILLYVLGLYNFIRAFEGLIITGGELIFGRFMIRRDVLSPH